MRDNEWRHVSMVAEMDVDDDYDKWLEMVTSVSWMVTGVITFGSFDYGWDCTDVTVWNMKRNNGLVSFSLGEHKQRFWIFNCSGCICTFFLPL